MEEGPAATEESSGSTSDAPGPKGEGDREATTRISEESCQQESWTEVPKYFSHAWTPGHRYCNLTWAPNAPPPNQKTSKPPVQSVGDRVVQVRIPLGQSTRKSRRPGAIEIYCGHAGLTAALCDAGLDGVGVDWKRNKHKPTVPILYADLTTGAGQQIMWELAQQKHVRYVPLAPPCGTYSRAREKPIPKWQLRLGAPNLQPLRSDERPEGLSPRHMTPLDSLKVRKGNEIANFCARIASYCLDERKLFSIENPSGSLIWEMPDMKAVCRREGVVMVNCHVHMWDSSRDERTTFMTNSKEIEYLRKQYC